eukprot:scaffold15537_cov170-Amphora_coffeaeformis.AAC.6
MPRTTARHHTVKQCLTDLEIVGAEVFVDCTNRDEEFHVIKKKYLSCVLQHHPDKGMNDSGWICDVQGHASHLRRCFLLHTQLILSEETPKLFRQVQTSFELLRDLHSGNKQQRRKTDWLESLPDGAEEDGRPSANESQEEVFDMSQYDDDFSKQETPGWEFYQAATEKVPPIYRVETAKSGMSRCKQKSKVGNKWDQTTDGQESTALVDPSVAPEVMTKGEIRVGWNNEQTGLGGLALARKLPRFCQICGSASHYGSYLGSMDHILAGFEELSESNQQIFISHCRDRSNWATYRKPKKVAPTAPVPEDDEIVPPAAAARLVASSEAIIPGRQKFVVPQPGVNGASGNTVFSGKTFVTTGVFPEIGGGQGLTLGKDRVELMIESFGGRVTGSISGRTDVLVVGKETGMDKVSEARTRPKVVLATLQDVKDSLNAGLGSLEEFNFLNREEPLKIMSFSAGYKSNGKALQASKEEMDVAVGVKKAKPKAARKKAPPPEVLAIEGDQNPSAKPSSSGKKRKALEDMPSSPNVTDGSKSPPKKRETAPRSAKNVNETSSTAIVVADETKKKKRSKTKKTDKIESEGEEDDSMEDVIACDQVNLVLQPFGELKLASKTHV